MATVKQLIAELREHPKMNDAQKAYVENLLVWAEARVKQKLLEKQRTNPRRRSYTNKELITVQQWAMAGGWEKTAHAYTAWVKEKNLDPKMVNELLDEFIDEMKSKGNRYADFYKTFQTYLRKGYLSKPMAACIRKTTTNYDTRGVTL